MEVWRAGKGYGTDPRHREGSDVLSCSPHAHACAGSITRGYEKLTFIGHTQLWDPEGPAINPWAPVVIARAAGVSGLSVWHVKGTCL